VRRVLARIDGWQRRHAIGGFPVAVLKKFGEDRASSLAALSAYYAFFSLFPLLLAFVSVLGFVLEGDPALRDDVIDTALARIPVIGAELRDDVRPLTGSGVALVIGLAGALWAGLGVTVALGRAFSEIWDVPRVEQPSGLKARARGLLALVVFGVTLVAATIAAGAATGGGIDAAAQRALALVGSLAGNAIVFLTVFALLTPERAAVRALLPGVVLAAAGLLLLQALGGWYVDRTVTEADATYGVFALVIGLLSWFFLAAHLMLVAAVVNVVLARRLWPRSLTGALTPADERAFRRSSEATRRDPRQRIAVSFEDRDPPSSAGRRP
jgi:YihY family inner membrane protein